MSALSIILFIFPHTITSCYFIIIRIIAYIIILLILFREAIKCNTYSSFIFILGFGISKETFKISFTMFITTTITFTMVAWFTFCTTNSSSTFVYCFNQRRNRSIINITSTCAYILLVRTYSCFRRSFLITTFKSILTVKIN